MRDSQCLRLKLSALLQNSTLKGVRGIVHRIRGLILGRKWDKSLKSFPPLLFTVNSTNVFNPPPLEHKWVETGL